MDHPNGCLHCGAELHRKHKRGPRPSYCDARCRAAYHAARKPSPHAPRCNIEVLDCAYCGQAHTAKTRRKASCDRPDCRRAHHNERQKAFYRKWKAEHGEHYGSRYFWGYTKTCQSCGRTWETKNKHAKRCGDCRYRYARDRKAVVVHPDPPAVTHLSRKHPAISGNTPTTHIWVSCYCHECGEHFVIRDQAQARYCSNRCAGKLAKRKRRAAKYAADSEPYRTADIYERDGWRCQICHRKVRRDVSHRHDLAPTIDHIIPVSAGGPDAPINVQCAHRRCNYIKNATGPGQLRLVGA